MNLFRTLFLASRSHTLTASLSPVLLSYALLGRDFYLHVSWYAFCALIQLATNLHNDYADHVLGADDSSTRVGSKRVTSAGLLRPTTTLGLSLLLAASASAVAAFVLPRHAYLPFIAVTSVANVFLYTGGPPTSYVLGSFSYAYSGSADVVCFLYFGLAAAATPALLSSAMSPAVLGAGVVSGLQSAAILTVNNVRDRFTDPLAGKNTIAATLGGRVGRMMYTVEVLTPYLLALLLYPGQLGGGVVAAPVAFKAWRWVMVKEGRELDKGIGMTAAAQVLFAGGVLAQAFLQNEK